MSNKTVTLRNSRDDLGLRHLAATLSSNRTLTIEGQDIGDGVEQVYGPGNREYEWTWTIRSSDVAKLRTALDAGDDVLAALRERFSGEAAADLQAFLDENGISYEMWSRIGD